MSLSSAAIDRIVANVLSQISDSRHAQQERLPVSPVEHPVSAPSSVKNISLPGAVITAESLQVATTGSIVTVQRRAIVTPAAWDEIRGRKLQLQRGGIDSSATDASNRNSRLDQPGSGGVTNGLAIVVRHTAALEQTLSVRDGSWQRELMSCPDDAAKLAISEISRGGARAIVILAEQVHRAACLANRHGRVKAVAVRDAGEIKEIQKQLRANVWCINPESRSFFELKMLLQQIENGIGNSTQRM